MSRKRRGRGEGAIFQREDGLWCASLSLGYSDTGKRRRRIVYGKSKRDVQEKLRRLHDDSVTGRLTDAPTLAVKEWLVRWLESCVSRLAPKTHLRYSQLIRLRINPHLGGAKLSKLLPMHVQQFYSALERDGVTPRGVQMAGMVLGKALRDAVRLRLIVSNPAADVAKPRPRKTPMHVYSARQAQSLLKAASRSRNYPLFVVALDTGMRQGELFALLWQDVDLQKGRLTVQRSLEEINGKHRLKEPKSGKGRRIELSRFALDALQGHRRAMLASGHYRPDGPVFTAPEGGWIVKGNFLRRVFRPIQKKAKLPMIRFHDLRHTAATLMLAADVNVKIVSERLGHASVQITLDTYSHVLPSMQRIAAQRMDGFFRQNGPESRGLATVRLQN